MLSFHDILGCASTLVVALALVAMTGAWSSAKSDVAAAVIALERSCLGRWGKGDPMGFVEVAAPRISYFDPYLERRVDGREAFAAYMASIRGKVSMDGFELLNPEVEEAGDVAVLSFNYVSFGTTDGTAWQSRWNATEVFRRFPDGWRIVHSHWSKTRPDPAGSLA